MAELRKSISAVRTFLLTTALQLTMTKNQIAEVLYEIMSLSGLLELIPVSEGQLERFLIFWKVTRSFSAPQTHPQTIL